MSVNRKSIVHMLKAIHQNGSNSNSDSIIKFIPIFNSPYDSNKIGVDIDGYWCIANDERIWSPRKVDVKDSDFCSTLAQTHKPKKSLKS